MDIRELQPKAVWENFYGITRIPRPSKHEEKIREYLLSWAEERTIEAFACESGNVIMRVPATPGYENRPGVVLQAHMDMVPQKNAQVEHDFLTDSIETWIDGEWVRAKGTTLGADNGLGLALALAILESKDVPHGPLELLATYNEETGMTGAMNLKPGLLNGSILINVDTECDHELCIGCAGGLDALASTTYSGLEEPSEHVCYSLVVKGLRGGHSGLEINCCRANANKVAARLVYALLQKAGAKLVDLEGGTLRNAIPREAAATLYIPCPNEALASEVVEKVWAEVRAEYSVTDPLAECIFEPYRCEEGECCDPDECKYVAPETALTFVRAILACPDGVERMSSQVEGLVETSINMGVVKIGCGKFEAHFLLRSSVDTAKDLLAGKLAALFSLAGIDVSFTGGYSGWAPNQDSKILKVMKGVYEDMFHESPHVVAVHAGLECGILAGAYPHWDMISCGPTLESPHSPDERAFIPSVAKMWEFLKKVIVSVE